MKISVYYFVSLFVVVFMSCSNENQEVQVSPEQKLVKELNFLGNSPNVKYISSKDIDKSIIAVEFDNIEEARNYLVDFYTISSLNYETSFFEKVDLEELKSRRNSSSDSEIHIDNGILFFSCPPPVFAEFIPCDGDEDGGVGCGREVKGLLALL